MYSCQGKTSFAESGWANQQKSGPPGNTEAIWNGARKLDTVTSGDAIAATEMPASIDNRTTAESEEALSDLCLRSAHPLRKKA